MEIPAAEQQITLFYTALLQRKVELYKTTSLTTKETWYTSKIDRLPAVSTAAPAAKIHTWLQYVQATTGSGTRSASKIGTETTVASPRGNAHEGANIWVVKFWFKRKVRSYEYRLALAYRPKNPFRVQCPRGFWEIRLWHVAPVFNVALPSLSWMCVFYIRKIVLFAYFFVCIFLGLKGSHISSEKVQKKTRAKCQGLSLTNGLGIWT